MRLNEFHKQPSSTSLNENLAAMFGQKLNLESFTLEQLENARNKIRTRLSQFEVSEGFNAVYEDETYTKNKMFLDVLNRAIEERQDVIQISPLEQMVLDKVEEGIIAFEDLPEELRSKISEKAPPGAKAERMVKHIKSGYSKDGKLSDKEKSIAYATAWKHHNKSKNEGVIREGEEEKAELIMAARDMVDRITGWMEDTANMQAEAMLELIDSIRDELGGDLAMEFESVVKPALATIYTALESSRQQLTSGVGLLTGEGSGEMMGAVPPTDDLGGDLDAGIEPELDADDQFAADQAAAGGEEETGRATRESIEYSRRLGTLLAPKKK